MKVSKKSSYGSAPLVTFGFNFIGWTKNIVKNNMKSLVQFVKYKSNKQSNQKQKFTAGFTLVEMVVVLAIIGIVTSIVLMSMSTARSQSRDKKKISDVKSIQLALELYYLKNATSSNSYPDTLAALAASPEGNGLPPEIDDNSTNTVYQYISYNPSNSDKCRSYHLGTILENSNAQFRTDADKFDSTDLSDGSCGSAVGFDALDNPLYFDVKSKY